MSKLHIFTSDNQFSKERKGAFCVAEIYNCDNSLSIHTDHSHYPVLLRKMLKHLFSNQKLEGFYVRKLMFILSLFHNQLPASTNTSEIFFYSPECLKYHKKNVSSEHHACMKKIQNTMRACSRFGTTCMYACSRFFHTVSCYSSRKG